MSLASTTAIANGVPRANGSGKIDAGWLPPITAAEGGMGFDGSSAPDGSLPIGNGAGFTLGTLTAGTNIAVTNTAGSITIDAAGAALTVATEDGVTSVANVVEIKVTNGTLTDDGSGVVSLDLGSGGGGAVSSVNTRTGAVVLTATDIPTMVASGGSHAGGAVPDTPGSSGSTKFLREDATWAIPSGGSGSISVAILQDQKSSTTDGGTSVANAWTAHDLQTIVSDTDSIITAALSSNEWQLAAGKYEVEAWQSIYFGHHARCRIYNVTDSVVEGLGPVTYTGDSAGGTATPCSATFTISGTKLFRIEYYVKQACSGNGLGPNMGIGTEVYASVTVRKIG